MSSIPKLRGHHLICLHFYKGEGYDDLFISSLNRLIDELNERGAFIIYGADDVCHNCPNLYDSRCVLSENADEEITEMDRLALSLINLKVGDYAAWQDIKKIIPSVIDTWYKECCLSCFWFDKCTVRSLL